MNQTDKVFILMETALEQGRYKTNQLLKRTLRSDREGNPQGIPGDLWFGWCGLGRPLGDLKDGEEAKGGEPHSGTGNRKHNDPEAAKSSACSRSEGQHGEGARGEAGEGALAGSLGLVPRSLVFL